MLKKIKTEAIMSVQEYFLGGNSAVGFRTKFSEQINKPGFYTYILKGGPGTGKSTLMKKTAEYFSESPMSLYRCSSDLNSLDAVVIEDKKIIIVDGTAPHVFDPVYPGVSQEIINLGNFWDKSKLIKNGKAIKSLIDENQKYHLTVRRYIEAISSLNSDIYRQGENALDKAKLEAYTERLSKKIMKKNSPSEKGKAEFRHLSAFTQEKYKTMPIKDIDSSYFIKDDYFAGGNMFLRLLADILNSNGYDVIISECNMLHETVYEHLIVKSLGISFVTGNFFNELTSKGENVINFQRFYNKEKLSSKKQRINFNKKAVTELSEEASNCLKKALEIHDELEKYYIDAIDFKKLDKMTTEFIQSL